VEEGVANVVLEAMGIGLPVVSSNCGGMAEVIQDRVNGLLFKNRNPAHMAAQIEELISLTPRDRESMAISARKTIEAQHSAKHLGEKMEALYQKALCTSE